MLLDTHEAVHETFDGFNLKAPEIEAFFTDHDVSPIGIVDYAHMICSAVPETEVTGGVLMALFTGGVALGLHLADLRTAQLRRPLLRILNPDGDQQ